MTPPALSPTATAADFEALTQVSQPFLLLARMSEDDATGLAALTRRRAPESALVTVLRGKKMTTEDSVFDEFAAALQFPWYFGQNWNALSECIRDLSWLPAPAHVLLVTSARQLLSLSDEGALEVFVRTLERAADRWRKPDPVLREQAAVPFHVVFQVTEEEADPFAQRLRDAGAEVGILI